MHISNKESVKDFCRVMNLDIEDMLNQMFENYSERIKRLALFEPLYSLNNKSRNDINGKNMQFYELDEDGLELIFSTREYFSEDQISISQMLLRKQLEKGEFVLAIKYAELDLREYDIEIAKLIDRLYLYVEKVTDELKLIESKTRVKLKDNSKNMTLYLGIQNYLVEKRHVEHVKNKVSRTVLLNNPFGAASSNHVLEAVFIISEQLGYQLIAVTAHTEGKFLSDYYPIVYSCKLRSSSNNKTQIMSKEKEINYAFLKDHSPASIIRLDEEEKRQLDLFGLI